jgi:alanine dehydrogenase
MQIGVPKEIKTNENRVALVPGGTEALVAKGHTVLLERGAGEGSGFEDAAYSAAGATIVPTAEEVWARAELIMKVKEPIEVEWPRMRRDQVIYTYFHFAADERLTRAVIASGAIAVAYETVQLPGGDLPLLTPMSEVAGRMAVQAGAKYLEKVYGGRGILLGGVPGVAPAEVVILGGGTVGINAAKMAAGLGAHVTILDISIGCATWTTSSPPTATPGSPIATTSSMRCPGPTWWWEPCCCRAHGRRISSAGRT